MNFSLDPQPTPPPAKPVPSGSDNPNATPLYDELLQHFPFPSMRPAQVRALDGWSNAVNKSKQFGIFELPTGAGKSALSWTIGSHAQSTLQAGVRPGAYILTTQKSLQEQYMRDFAKQGMADLKGAANYRCHDFDTDCQTGTLMRNAHKKATGEETKCTSCEYRAAKLRFIGAPIGVTNFAYFLSEVAHIGQLPPRNVLIIDEAHNTESQILGQVEIEITKARCETFGAPPPRFFQAGATLDARAYVLDTFLPAAQDAIARLDELSKDLPMAERMNALKRIAGMKQFTGKINALKEDPANLTDWFCSSDDATGALKLRPLTAARIAHEALFKMGHRVVFMSATILDAAAFARGLGISPSNGGFCRVESDFPIENRPIHFFPVGSMSRKNIAASTPAMLRFIERILTKHANERGIIHAQSYALANTIKKHLDTTDHASRILMPEAGYGSRKQALDQHHSSDEPTVLLSPSMTEGLDLHGDLSRFCICPKVPYPSLGDPFVKARMEYDANWYGWTTALSLIQATGRSIRSREDHAVTYILDSDFENFMSRSGGIMPKWWTDSIQYHQ